MYRPEEHEDPNDGYDDPANNANGQSGVYQPNEQGNGVYQDEFQQGEDDEEVRDNNQQQQGGDADSYGDSFDEGEMEHDDGVEDEIAYNGQPGNDVGYDTDPEARDDQERFDDEGVDDQENQYGAGGAQPEYDDGQDGGYDAGQSGYGAHGPDVYGQSGQYDQYGQPRASQQADPQNQQQYDQYGQPQAASWQSQQQSQTVDPNRASWQSQQSRQPQQAAPYGRPQPDPYAQSRTAQPEQFRPVPEKNDEDVIIRKNVLTALIIITAVLVLVVVLVVVLLIVFLGDDNDSTPKPAPAPTTPAPTPSPGTPTIAPTANAESPGWQSTSANTFSATKSGAGFGGALAIAGDTLVAGIPDKAGKPGFGTVLTYSRASGVRAFSTNGDTTEATAELFGAALDMSYDSATDTIKLAVGAPRTDGILANIVSFGTVYIYTLDRSSETWSRVGDVIRSTETLEEAGGEFGNAVALAADVDRVAVGAPSRSLDMDNLNTGGVTVYELQNNVWTTMPTTPLLGPPESYYGQAIDMSDDGTGLIVGAPGRGDFPGGQVDFFKYDGSSKWELAYTKSGTGSDQMGTTVAIINSEGTQIAYGMPGSSNTRGAVRVMEDGGSGTFTQMGDDIVGTDTGEMVGMVMCSKNSRVAVGTQTGILRVYDFSGGAWVPLLNQPDVGVAITTCAMTETGEAIVVGMANDQVKVFDLVGQ